ncbi:MAG: amidohydrolase family protein, partial [Acidobacteriaceae bacterium]
MKTYGFLLTALALVASAPARAQAPAAEGAPVNARPIVLHAARLFDVETGRIVTPGEVLVEGDRIGAAGSSVEHPPGARVIDLGDTTLMPGLI